MKTIVWTLLLILAAMIGLIVGICVGYDWRDHHDK